MRGDNGENANIILLLHFGLWSVVEFTGVREGEFRNFVIFFSHEGRALEFPEHVPDHVRRTDWTGGVCTFGEGVGYASHIPPTPPKVAHGKTLQGKINSLPENAKYMQK